MTHSQTKASAIRKCLNLSSRMGKKTIDRWEWALLTARWKLITTKTAVSSRKISQKSQNWTFSCMMTRINTMPTINLMSRRVGQIKSVKLLIKNSQQKQNWPSWINSTGLHNPLSSFLILPVFPLRRTLKTVIQPFSFSLNEKIIMKTPQAPSSKRSP